MPKATKSTKLVKEAPKRTTKTSSKKTVTTKTTTFPFDISSLRAKLDSIRNNIITIAKNYNKLPKKTYVIIIVVGLLLLAGYKKSLFIAATVNGTPITNLQVLSRINDQYREQTLNQMVNEQIVANAAKKQGVNITESDVNNKIADLEKNVGGKEALDSLLANQGQTRSSLKDQIKLQLMIEKMFEKDATVSAQEVEKFIADNKEGMQATDSAGLDKEATDALKQQKLSEVFRSQFQKLRQEANIQIFK